MVSTQANVHQSPRRPKNKLRTKRTKRRIGRRIGTTPSDSKSSLENADPQPVSPLGEKKPEDVVLEPRMKKRSLSEERQPSRVKIGQRSSSLQLDSTTQPSLRLSPVGAARRQQPALPKRKAWFFSWPVRLVVPNRTTIEDEGFDSFHGNNSSSSDCENDTLLETHPQSNPLGVVGLTELKTSDTTDGCLNGDLKYETQNSDSVPLSVPVSHLDSQGNFSFILSIRVNINWAAFCTDNDVIHPMLRRRRNLPSIALKLIPPETNQAYVINSETESEPPPRNPKCVTIMSSER